MRLTLVVDPGSPSPAEHRVEVGDEGVLIGSGDDVHVVVSGAASHHVRLRVIDAGITCIALAPGVRVRDAGVDGLQAHTPEAALRGPSLDIHQAKRLLRGDVVRLTPPRGGPARELRVDVGLVALGWRRALARGLPLAAFASVVLSGVAVRGGLAGLVALMIFGLLITGSVAAATLVELWVARAGATWWRRLLAAAAICCVVTLGMTGATVNLRHAASVAAEGLRVAGDGAARALAGCASLAVAQRLLALGLTAALVLDTRWSRWPVVASTLVNVLGPPIAWFAALMTVTAARLPRQAGDVVWATNMDEAAYGFGSLMLAALFAWSLNAARRRWPVGGDA